MHSRALDSREKQRRSSCKWRAAHLQSLSCSWAVGEGGGSWQKVTFGLCYLGSWYSLRKKYSYKDTVRLVRYKHLVFDIISVTVQSTTNQYAWIIHLAICLSIGWGLEEMWLKHEVVAERRKSRISWEIIKDLCTFEQEAMYFEKKEAKRIFVSCRFKSCCLWWDSLQLSNADLIDFSLTITFLRKFWPGTTLQHHWSMQFQQTTILGATLLSPSVSHRLESPWHLAGR